MTSSTTSVSISDMELDKHYAVVSSEGFRTYMGAYTGYLAHGSRHANMFFIRPGHNTVNFLFSLDTKFFPAPAPKIVENTTG
jgi:hypothetical protein